MIDKQLKKEGSLFDRVPLEPVDKKDRRVTTLVDDLSRLARYEAVSFVPSLVFDCIYANVGENTTRAELFSNVRAVVQMVDYRNGQNRNLSPDDRRRIFRQQLRAYASKIVKVDE